MIVVEVGGVPTLIAPQPFVANLLVAPLVGWESDISAKLASSTGLDK